MKVDEQYTEKITYESVEKTFTRKIDAIDYILDTLYQYRSRP